MGRYYIGDIHGKFWFAIQESNDASYFGVVPPPCYSFSCGCDVDEDIELITDLYCTSCYSSSQEHRDSTTSHSLWHLRELVYSFDESNLPILERKCVLLERRFGKFIESYRIDGDTDYSYEVKLKETVPSEHLPSLARLCLGRLILHCIKSKKSCTFFCEI
jgi:hypothetical protein